MNNDNTNVLFANLIEAEAWVFELPTGDAIEIINDGIICPGQALMKLQYATQYHNIQVTPLSAQPESAMTLDSVLGLIRDRREAIEDTEFILTLSSLVSEGFVAASLHGQSLDAFQVASLPSSSLDDLVMTCELKNIAESG